MATQIKKKDEPQPSQVQRPTTASSEVKQRLQEFLAKKQAREQAAAAAAAAAASSGNTSSPPTGPPGNRIPWHLTLGKYDHDFPLRKTGKFLFCSICFLHANNCFVILESIWA